MMARPVRAAVLSIFAQVAESLAGSHLPQQTLRRVRVGEYLLSAGDLESEIYSVALLGLPPTEVVFDPAVQRRFAELLEGALRDEPRDAEIPMGQLHEFLDGRG